MALDDGNREQLSACAGVCQVVKNDPYTALSVDASFKDDQDIKFSCLHLVSKEEKEGEKVEE